MGALKFAEVAVDSHVGSNRTFTYSVPSSLSLLEGQLVSVPFGRQTLEGLVFSVTKEPRVENTKNIFGLSEEKPLLDKVRLLLARWLSEYYMCSLFEAASLMIPRGVKSRNITWISTKDSAPETINIHLLKDLQKNVFAYVNSRGRVSLEKVLKYFGQNARFAVTRLVDMNLLLREDVKIKPAVGPRFEFIPYVTDLGLDMLRIDGFKGASRQKELVRSVASLCGPKTVTEARKEFGYTVVKAAEVKGFIKHKKQRVFRDPLKGKVYDPDVSILLTKEQEFSLATIVDMLEKPNENPRAILIHGVTGSGKTEVYLKAVQHCLNLGKRAIVLVPEIALTPQIIERFGSRFNEQVAVMHSGLSAGERFDQWWKIRDGKYSVVIGSRSAIFAPQPELGLVIIDEEHEWTYKQNESSPRYHARDVAMQLAGLTRSTVVLGSASPDVESFHRAKRNRYRLSKLSQRFLHSPRLPRTSIEGDLAPISLVDMRDELRSGNRDIFSKELRTAIEETLLREEQVILFLNRRGASSLTQCRTCGHVIQCRSCDIALTYHTYYERLVCHYCGRRTRLSVVCPTCGSSSLSRYGIGTQLVSDKVSELFPEANVIRWDRDAAKHIREYENILREFRSGGSQILVGTQLIAKGHHIPTVTLVGVVSADIGLGVPDFRTGERTFQLLCQVAGRAGRGEKPGRVIIQTHQPDHYAIAAAATQDYTSFFEIESSYRKRYIYPPFSKLIRLVYHHTNNATSERRANDLVESINSEQGKWGLFDTDVIGPTPGYPPKVRGNYRWQIILRGPKPRALLDKVNLITSGAGVGNMPKGWIIDVDPVSFS